MRPTIAIVMLAAAALAGCGAGGAAADSSQLSQYVASGAASSAPSPSGGSGSAPTCFTAADVKSTMGIDVVDLTGGMRKYGTFWNCGYVPTDTTTYRGASVQLTVSSAAEADETFKRLTFAMRIARGPTAQPDVLQIGDRAMAYDTPSGAVAAAVTGDRLYVVETMYGTAGQNFTDKKDPTIELLRKMTGG
ncbi:MAG TPA: hypothetical protein VFS59_11310 [Gemmatimonadaceae bacterium]|nr:hypothetical protein [Gemmatimonadaceae bacterium]